MAMLAEPRRKQRIGPNPRGQLFIDDEHNVGRSMLRTMGWKEGDGLGATHQGINAPIKPKVQPDSRGLGFDVKSSPWVVHNDKFSELLADLNVEYRSNDNAELELQEKVPVETTSAAGIELEKKSKSSRARIHYHKSIKNKDLSKITSKDWNCIFGKSIDVDEKDIGLNPTKLNSDENQTEQEAEKYIHAGSMVDYFKTKMQEKLSKLSKKKLLKLSQQEIQPKQESSLDNIDMNCERLKKKRKYNKASAIGVSKDEEWISSNFRLDKFKIPDYEAFVNEGSTTNDFEDRIQRKFLKQSKDRTKMMLDSDLNLENPEKKKKKKRKDVDADVTQVDCIPQDTHKKEKKKPKNQDTDFIHQDSSLEQPESGLDKVDISCERSKKKKTRNLESAIGVSTDEKSISSNFKLSNSNNQDGEKFVNAGSMTDYFEAQMRKKLSKQSKSKISSTDSSCTFGKSIDEDKNDIQLNPTNLNSLENQSEQKTGKYIQSGSMVDSFQTKIQEKLLKLSQQEIQPKQESSLDNIDMNCERLKKKRKYNKASAIGVSKDEEWISSNFRLDKFKIPDYEAFVNEGSTTNDFEDRIQRKFLKQSKDRTKMMLDSDLNLENPEKKKKKKRKDVDADVTQVDCIPQDTHKKEKKKPKNQDTDFIHQDSSLEQPAKKRKKKCIDTDVVHEEVSSKSPVSGEVECNISEAQGEDNVTRKARNVWDETTVTSVANQYVGANILDIPGYPISTAIHNLHDVTL